MIVRFQGGANAGHAVEVGDKKFVFHLIPSGIEPSDESLRWWVTAWCWIPSRL